MTYNKQLVKFLTLILISGLLFFPTMSLNAQEADTLNLSQSKKGFLSPADTFSKPRFYSALGLGVAGYSATLYGLSNAWYSQYDRSSFHFYDDFGVWRNMDKLGHAYTTYLYTDVLHGMSKWTGMNDRSALWLAAGAANFFQLTIEVLDGFSAEWGFSMSDFAANITGSVLYVSQHLLWEEQRVRLKFSTFPQTYGDHLIPSHDNSGTMTYKDRASDLYGRGLASRLLKDYNGQTYWLSVNPASFNVPHPDWLNWAIGIGAADMYAGESNTWVSGSTIYHAPFPQKTIFYLSPDLNWSAFRGKSDFMNTLLGILNYVKAPLPAVSIDTQGNIGWYLVFF